MGVNIWFYVVRQGKLYLELRKYAKKTYKVLKVFPAKENYFIRVAK